MLRSFLLVAGLCAAVALLLAAVSAANAATRIELNGEWQFRPDTSGNGEQQGWARQAPGETETVRVPHTWNIGRHEDYEGTAWYFKTFSFPEELRGKRVELHFGATFYRSRVWLNGVAVGGHSGGHTAYFFDVTPHLKRTNSLAVEVNNQPAVDTIPGWAMKLWGSGNIWYDWWHYGGIVREVWLSVREPMLVRRQHIRAKVEGRAASLTDNVFLENHSGQPVTARVLLKAWPPQGGAPAATAEKQLTLAPGAQSTEIALRLERARLWHFDDPQVYRMEAELLDARGNPLDSITDNFGVRTIEINNRRLHLNGKPIRLTGMTRHQETPWEGLAETAGTMRKEYDELKALQVTLTRPVHYPQHPAILDYADRNGILLIPEIPMWQFSEKQMSDPKVIALAQQMMREMIEQDINHPSIFAWSVSNESATDTPGGMAYFRKMYDLIKSLDPGRFVTYADDRIAFVSNPANNSAGLADFIMWNQYFGTWHAPAEQLTAALEHINRNYPTKMVVISEFGVPGVFAQDAEGADRLRVRILREQLQVFGKHDWIGGAIFWCYQDYKSHRNLWPGESKGYVDHGVVDENRQRRPSFAAWQQQNAPARMAVEWRYDGERRPVGFRAAVERRRADEIPSYSLRNYRLAWELRDRDNRWVAGAEEVLPEIGEAKSLEGKWPSPPVHSAVLRLRLYRPNGFLAAEKLLRWLRPSPGGLDIDDMKRQGAPLPQP